MSILFLTFDGILEPLPYSQVFRPLAGLVAAGFDYTLVSLEKPELLANETTRGQLADACRAAGLEWIPVPYTRGGPQAAARNIGALAAAAHRASRRRRIRLVHARSYPAALVARSLRIPYLFDTRGYWIDEKADRWFGRSSTMRVARRIERDLYENAAAIVMLTDLSSQDVREQRKGVVAPDVPVVTIPTCADFAEFERPDLGLVPADLRAQLQDALVLGYIGSVNAFYFGDKTFELLRMVRRLASRPVHLLALTPQTEVFGRLCERFRHPLADVTIRSVPHALMPPFIALLDWAFLLAPRLPARRASMPTKLAEMFASAVRPIQHGTNEEVDAWVSRAGSGLVLSDLAPNTLEEVAEHIARQPPSPRDESAIAPDVAHAREITRPHFDLTAGVQRYARLLRDLGRW